ncbi:MAG TPA: recombination protein RecR [Candidatus Avidesulfovibrio excrementigallinarum]|nr:recombination protein RecR [Candidatus Avidesulfovibrio excrementigallinarum]
MERIPEPLQALVRRLGRLPGLGPKSAMRVAMTLLKWPETETRQLGESIARLRDELHLCSRCGALTETDPCAICTDATRNEEQLCVVSEWDSMLTLEEGGFFKGRYFILGGLLSPLGAQEEGQPDIRHLEARLAEGQVREVILALGATVEAESTAAHLRAKLTRRFPNVRVCRLAQGIPLGAEVKFMDRETLRQALQYRQDF